MIFTQFYVVWKSYLTVSGCDPVLELNVRVPPAIGPIRTGWVFIVALTPEELANPKL